MLYELRLLGCTLPVPCNHTQDQDSSSSRRFLRNNGHRNNSNGVAQLTGLLSSAMSFDGYLPQSFVACKGHPWIACTIDFDGQCLSMDILHNLL